jgi:hypothetical protein
MTDMTFVTENVSPPAILTITSRGLLRRHLDLLLLTTTKETRSTNPRIPGVLDCIGLYWIVLDCTRLYCIGLDWIVLDCIVLDWIGL